MFRPLHRSLRAWTVQCALIVSLVSGGCRVGPDYAPPTLPAPDRWQQELQEGYFANQADIGAWWELLDDPVLNTLIECSADSNLDVHAALTRIWIARTDICIANAARIGSLTANGSYQRIQQSLNAIGAGGLGGGFGGFFLDARSIWSLGLAPSWEPDVWGRIYREVEAAEANMCGNVEAFRDVLVIMYAEIASTYVQVRTLQERLQYAESNVQIQERALELVKTRVDGGLSPILEQYQSESNLAGIIASIPPLEQALHRALNRLAVLAGEYPGTLHDCLATPQPIPEPPEKLPLTLPCDVIRQRPDIRQAERDLAARTALVGVAVADLYPRFQMGGTVSLSADNLGDIFDSDSLGYQLGPSFSWLLFNAGRVKCRIHRATFEVEEALANYQRAVLRGMEEVENSAVAYRTEKERKAALRLAVESAEKQLESVLELYRNDKTNFQNVLDSLRTLNAAQDAFAVSEGQTIQDLISLYRALGGGWSQSAHRVDRCVRLRCQPRPDASVADVKPEGNAADRFFETGADEDDGEAGPDPDQMDLPDVDGKPTDIDPESKFDVDAFFDRVLNRERGESGDRTKEGQRPQAEPPANDLPDTAIPNADATAPPGTSEIETLPSQPPHGQPDGAAGDVPLPFTFRLKSAK